MLMVPVEVPTTVLSEPLPVTLTGDEVWNTDKAVPDPVVLHWIEDEPFGGWSAALLTDIDPATLPERELPAYIKACDRPSRCSPPAVTGPPCCWPGRRTPGRACGSSRPPDTSCRWHYGSRSVRLMERSTGPVSWPGCPAPGPCMSRG